MKITKDNYLKATAEAMSTESSVELFNACPETFDMFTLFAYCVFNKVENKETTEEEFDRAVATIIAKSLPDKISDSTMLKDLALLVFANMIWSELEKLDKPEKDDPEYDKFKSGLKSKIN